MLAGKYNHIIKTLMQLSQDELLDMCTSRINLSPNDDDSIVALICNIICLEGCDCFICIDDRIGLIFESGGFT